MQKVIQVYMHNGVTFQVHYQEGEKNSEERLKEIPKNGAVDKVSLSENHNPNSCWTCKYGI
jgi:hypothetical protein